MLTAQQLMELADAFASEMLEFAEQHGIDSRDLLMTATVTQRLLQRVLAPDLMAALRAEQEADATLVASSKRLEGN